MLYTYKQETKIGGSSITSIVGIKESKITNCFEKFSYIAEWFSIAFLFYLNSIFIHSRIFSIFIFILGITLLFTLKFEKKLTTKKEFLQKVNEILKESEEN